MEPFELVIGDKNLSSWSLRPWLAMRQAGVAFRETSLKLREPSFKEQALKLSPTGKVPVLVHGELRVWESLAICEYVAELVPEACLWPSETGDRAIARAVSHEMHAGFAALRMECPMNVSLRTTKTDLSERALADIRRVVELWTGCREGHCSKGPFLFGTFTIADAMYSPVAFRFQTYGVRVEGIAGEYMRTVLGLEGMKEWASPP